MCLVDIYLIGSAHIHTHTHSCCSFENEAENDGLLFTVHSSLSAVTHAAFHASMLRPASQAGPMHESTVVGEVS